MGKISDKEEGNPCFGYCVDCGEKHSLSAERAIPHALEIMNDLRIHRRIDFDRPLHEADPRLTLEVLYGRLRGEMFGVLVCEDAEGKEIVHKAFSCQYHSVWEVPGWVSPLFDVSSYNAIMNPGSDELHRMTDKIANLHKDSLERKQLTEERKRLSQKIMAELHDLYRLNNFRGETRSLRNASIHTKGLPTGIGDCCAPKLLNHAAKCGHKPIALAEFFMGIGTVSGNRIEGEFYGACENKCQPILGFMLCGAENGK